MIVTVVPLPVGREALVFPEPIPDRRPARRVAARAWRPVARPSLTEGRGPYVGEPRVPAILADPPEAPAALAPVADPLGLLAMGVAEIAAAPPMVADDEQPRPAVLRRATLAQSRRLGLAIPTHRPEVDDPPQDEPVDDSPDPLPAEPTPQDTPPAAINSPPDADPIVLLHP
jgi:hypothetical protein